MGTDRKVKDGWVPPPNSHGKDSTYARGCRCDKCREAHRVRAREDRKHGKRGSNYQRKYVERNKAERYWDVEQNTWVHPNPPSGHGATGSYTSFGCRCNACRQAMRDQGRKARTNRANHEKQKPTDWLSKVEVDTSSVFTWSGR